MPTLHLTDLSVRALKGSERYETYWDETTPAFGIRVGKRTKTWTVMRGRNRERVTIGRYPDVPLTEARKAARRLLADEPEPKPLAITFATAREEFLTEHYKDKGARTKANVASLMRRHFRIIENDRLVDIEDGDIKRCLDRLSATPSEQLHAYRAVRCFFRWCLRPPRRYIKHSPMEGYEPPGRDRKGTRVLSDDELLAVWKAPIRPSHGVARLMVLWGTRNGETAVLERSWVTDGVLTIPGEHTKNGRDHSIPIGPLAEHVLSTLPRHNFYFLPGRWGEGALSARGLAKLVEEVKTLSGTSGWMPRDLRRTFRSNMARLGVPRDLCEVLINHAPPVLDEIYDRYDRIAEKREALYRYECFIAWSLAWREAFTTPS